MATQLSAVTMIGTTGQGATDGMRFVQFYFGLPIAMVILGVTLVPFLPSRARSTPRTSISSDDSIAKTRSLTAFLFLVSRAMSCGTIIAAPAVVFSAMFGWNLWWCVAIIGVPTIIYTMIGGVQAVTWVDVKQMFVIVGALFAVVITLLVQDSRCRRTTCFVSPDRPDAARLRLLVQPHEHVHVLVRSDRRHVPDALVLRHRPEPGAALSLREVGGRGAELAPHQRVLEDSAAGAGAARRRAGVRVLSVPSRAAAVQSGAGAAVQAPIRRRTRRCARLYARRHMSIQRDVSPRAGVADGVAESPASRRTM